MLPFNQKYGLPYFQLNYFNESYSVKINSIESNKRKSFAWLLDKQSGGIKMQEKNHFCEFEVCGELIFCTICGEQPQIGGEVQ